MAQPSPLTRRFGSISLDLQYEEPEEGVSPGNEGGDHDRGITPRLFRDLRLFKAAEEGRQDHLDESLRIPTSTKRPNLASLLRGSSYTPSNLNTTPPISKKSTGMNSTTPSIRKQLHTVKDYKDSTRRGENAALHAGLAVAQPVSLIPRPIVTRPSALSAATKIKEAPTSMNRSRKVSPPPNLSPHTRGPKVARDGCDIVDPDDDDTESYAHTKKVNRGRDPVIPRKSASPPRRRFKTPVSRIAPRNFHTPVRVAGFDKAEATAAERKKNGIQRKARIFKQAIKVDGLSQDRLELFWKTLIELKDSNKLFTGNKMMSPRGGGLCRYDDFEKCIKAVDAKLGSGIKKFGKKEGGAAMRELQNQRMLAIAGVNSSRVFLTRDAQAVLGA